MLRCPRGNGRGLLAEKVCAAAEMCEPSARAGCGRGGVGGAAIRREKQFQFEDAFLCSAWEPNGFSQQAFIAFLLYVDQCKRVLL